LKCLYDCAAIWQFAESPTLASCGWTVSSGRLDAYRHGVVPRRMRSRQVVVACSGCGVARWKAECLQVAQRRTTALYIQRRVDVSGYRYRIITAKETSCCPYVLRRIGHCYHDPAEKQHLSYHQGGSRRVAHGTQTRAAVTWSPVDSTCVAPLG
jgi:hypothetical protein